MNYSPVVLFVYNRPEHTLKTLESLEKCFLSDETELFIFADGPKKNADQVQIERIKKTRDVIKLKKWCKKVNIVEKQINDGLAKSIIDGVSSIINQYGTVIVLEDDIIIGKYFLKYMNDALIKYHEEKKVWHITGWRCPVEEKPTNEDAYFYPVMDCWGWATWNDRWSQYEKNPAKLKKMFSSKMINEFNMDGVDRSKWLQIEENACGLKNTWAIFWYAQIFINHGLCLAPTKSLIINIGLDGSGTNCSNLTKPKNSGMIDFEILRFPNVIQTSKDEYEKNKEYYKRIDTPQGKLAKLKKMARKVLPIKLWYYLKSYHKVKK